MSAPPAHAGPPRTLCFDLDGTLCTNTFGEYAAAVPLPAAIDRVNALAAAGHRILVFTARGTATGLDWEQVTRAQLERWGVAYEELHFGKPSADVYIDDRAVHTDAWMRGDAASPPGLPRGLDGELPVVGAPQATTVVELGRTFAGQPLRLDEHVDRVRALAAAAGVSEPPAPADIRSAVLEAIGAVAPREVSVGEATVLADLVYAVSLSGAAGAAHLGTGQGPPAPLLQVACLPLRQPAGPLGELVPGGDSGEEIAVAASLRHGTDGRPAWPLTIADGGEVRDGLGGTLGLVQGTRLSLAPASGPPTVPLAWLGELAGDLGIELVERPLTGADLVGADEVLTIGIPWCLVPIAAIDGRRVGEGRAGPVSRRLLEAWSAVAGLDLAAQARSLAAHSSLGGGSSTGAHPT